MGGAEAWASLAQEIARSARWRGALKDSTGSRELGVWRTHPGVHTEKRRHQLRRLAYCCVRMRRHGGQSAKTKETRAPTNTDDRQVFRWISVMAHSDLLLRSLPANECLELNFRQMVRRLKVEPGNAKPTLQHWHSDFCLCERWDCLPCQTLEIRRLLRR